MAIYPTLYETYRRLRARIAGDSRYRLLAKLRGEQMLSIERLQQVQQRRLAALLAHAAARSPFYKERLTRCGWNENEAVTLEGLRVIPLLTRDDLQNHRTDIMAADPAELEADASGGSTGQPVNFYHDDNYRTFAAACELLFLEWMRVSQGDRTAVLWGADRDFCEMSLKERFYERLKRTRILNSFRMDNESIDKFLIEMAALKPPYVIGYASSLHVVAERMIQTGVRSWQPRAVRSAAEMLYDYQRESIEKAFGSAPYNFYGSREVSHLAAECDRHNGLHIFASGRIVEIVDESGQPVPAGVAGRLAVTDLTNFGFPFLRYLNGDMGMMAAEPCPCGRGWPILTRLVGRTTDIIQFGGKLIHGEFFTHLFYGRPEVRQFQVVQKSERRLVIKIVAAETDFDERSILDPVRKEVGEAVDIQIDLVEAIEPTASGKYRFTVNECQQQPAKESE